MTELQMDFTWKNYPSLMKNISALLYESPNTKTILNWRLNFQEIKPSWNTDKINRNWKQLKWILPRRDEFINSVPYLELFTTKETNPNADKLFN